MWRKRKFQRGQAMLLYALLVPVMVLFVGVGLDLGWYYLNVSRLQNAADAVALAGAYKIISSDEEFKDYDESSVRLVENILDNEPIELSTVGDGFAASYDLKNLSPNTDAETVQQSGNSYIMNDAWGIGSSSEIKMTPSLYKIGEKYYYAVSLEEKIRHFFMPGLFESMNAPVISIALLAKTADDDDDVDPESPVVPPKEIEQIETVINKNVIVGNWEVQNYYRETTNSTYDPDPELESTRPGAKLTRSASFLKRFGFEVYTGSWNMFQDDAVHYKNGDLYRTETIYVFDDVKLVDYSKTGAQRYSDNNMASFGRTGNGINVKNPTSNGSSVQKTKASINKVDSTSYTYNTAGNPYVAEDLDSIDIDFQPEVGWKTDSVYPYQDWDLKFGYDKWSNQHVSGNGNANLGVGKMYHKKYNNDGSEQNGTERGGWSDHLRIHSTIDFGKAYPVRERIKDSDSSDRDILWVRIESEPMLIGPDIANGYTTTNLNSTNGIFGLNSVRQLIITNSAPNTGTDDRPIVIFYDGPERYSTDNNIRDSKPVIVYLTKDFNGILYMPNSPVVFIPNGHNFNGFIVAKSYMRLKTKEDFENEIGKYDRVDNNNNVSDEGEHYREKATSDNPYFGTKHTLKDEDGNVIKTNYRDNGEPKTINRQYSKITNPANGIEMYVDDYGNFSTWNWKTRRQATGHMTPSAGRISRRTVII